MTDLRDDVGGEFLDVCGPTTSTASCQSGESASTIDVLGWWIAPPIRRAASSRRASIAPCVPRWATGPPDLPGRLIQATGRALRLFSSANDD
jgi:hypothetical protein